MPTESPPTAILQPMPLGTKIVLLLPFLPKTTEQIIAASILAHQKVSSAHTKASFATSSQSLAGIIGNQNFDLLLEGDVDATTPTNPRVNLHLAVSNIIDANIINLDKKIYYRINSIPQGILGIISGYLGKELDDVSVLLNQWVEVEKNELKTEARDLLNQDLSQNSASPFDQAYADMLNRLYLDVIQPKIISTSEVKNGVPVHHLNLVLSGQTLDDVVKRLSENTSQGAMLYRYDTQDIQASDVVKHITIDLYIDQGTYFLNTLNITSAIDNSPLLDKTDLSNPYANSFLNRETYQLVFSLGLSAVGESIVINPPTNTISSEEYLKKATALFVNAPQSQPSSTDACVRYHPLPPLL
jgi:hypothetical protein